MEGTVCNEDLIIATITDRKYRDPWAMRQLCQDYSVRFARDLRRDIQDTTSGTSQSLILSLLRGPLTNDIWMLDQAMHMGGVDAGAVADVLMNRSSADVRTLAREYHRVHGKDLIATIRTHLEPDLYRLYSLILSFYKAEPSAFPLVVEVESKVIELRNADETVANRALVMAEILALCNVSQIRAISDAYHRKYRRRLREIVRKECEGHMQNVVLRMLGESTDRARSDAEWLREPLFRNPDAYGDGGAFVYRITSLY